MENKNKPKTTLKEVRKKKTKMKQKQKQKQQQSNKQTVKLNITTSGGGGGSGGSQQQRPSYMPNSFGNQEQTTLLKSINEQLKQKNEPVANATQNFNIPQPTPTSYMLGTNPENFQETQRGESFIIPTSSGIKRNRNLDEDYADINNRQQIFENEMQGLTSQFIEQIPSTPVITHRPFYSIEQRQNDTDEKFREALYQNNLKLKDTLINIPPQFREKVSDPTVIIEKEDLPIINKPKDRTNESLIEQTAKNQREEEKQPAEQKQPEEAKQPEQSKSRKEPNATTIEEKKIRFDNAVSVLLKIERDPAKREKLRRDYDAGDLSEFRVKSALRSNDLTETQIKELFSSKKK